MASSKLLPFVFIAALILITAVAWKMFSGNDSEPKVVQTIETPEPTKKPIQREVKPVKSNNAANVKFLPSPYEELQDMPLEEAKIASQKVAQNNMQFAMRYNTAERALSAVESYKKAGNDEMVKNLVDYIQIAFPNTPIPTGLVD